MPAHGWHGETQHRGPVDCRLSKRRGDGSVHSKVDRTEERNVKIKPKRKTVLFLGAGASVPHGYPVTAGILQSIWNGLTARRGGWRDWAGMKGRGHDAQLLRNLLEALLPGLGAGVALNGAVSIVDIISIVDQMAAEGRSPSPQLSERELVTAKRVLGMAINGVLQGKRKLHIAKRISQWALQVATNSRDSRFTIVSTNYDTVVESPLFGQLIKHGLSVGECIDFGMPWRDAFKDRLHIRPPGARLAMYKLHGSLNWLRCEVCGHITVNVRQRIAPIENWDVTRRSPHQECWCDGLLRSVLVTPSVVRDVRDASLLGIWQAAVEDLRMADEWIFVGYSLPAEDIAIRSLLLRAWHSRRQTDLRIRVVQFESCPPPSDTQQRYGLLFPPGNFKDDDYARDGIQGFVESLDLPTQRILEAQVRKCFGGRSAAQMARRSRS